MKGKRGPTPERLQTTDPAIETIIDPTDIVNVEVEKEQLEPGGYKCANCTFRSNLLSEMEEHVNGTGHGKFLTEPDKIAVEQPELFSTPGVIHRMIDVPIDDEILNTKRAALAELYQNALDVKAKKKSADAAFNSELADIDEQMQEVARVLAKPFTYEQAECEWRRIDSENARGLYRLDTGEMIEKAALTEEDRVAEMEKAQAENAADEKELEQEVGA